MNELAQIHEAGFWRRAIAILIDGVITLPIIGLFKMLGNLWAELVLSMAFYSIYVIVSFASRWEATPGMKMMGVRIVNAHGLRLGGMGALRWIVTSLLVTLVCLAPYLWFLSMVLKHVPMAEMVTLQRAGGDPAALLIRVADLEGIPLETFGEYAVMSSTATLLLFIFWVLTVAVLPKKRGIHNLFAKTYMVKTKQAKPTSE